MAQRAHRVGKDAADFGMALALLTKYFNMPADYMDLHRVRLYERGLEDVPGALLIEAAVRATKTRTWFPKVNELLADAEVIRAEMRAALVFTPCAMCSQLGWTEREIDGVKRMVRCRCWTEHQRKVEELGAGAKPLALPAADVKDWTQAGSIE